MRMGGKVGADLVVALQAGGVAAHASSLVVLLACGSLRAVASRLEPSHQRLGTHQQLGLRRRHGSKTTLAT